MKRFLFSVCALAAVVVGCSKSEVLNRPNAEVPIEFNPYTGRIPETRATVANEDTLGLYGFQVYAFMHDGNVNYKDVPYMDKVVKFGKKTEDAEESSWYYTGHAYWPATQQLNFLAYGLNTTPLPANEEDTEKVSKRLKLELGGDATDRPIINFEVPTVVADQEDLLVAASVINKKYDDKAEKDGGKVNLVFSHPLSRIGFTLLTSGDGDVLVTIKKVDLVGKFYQKGYVDLDNLGESTTLNDQAAGRPFIVPKDDATDQTYKLLGEAGTYTGLGKSPGEEIYNNGMLYEEIGTDTPTNYDDDEFKPKADATAEDKAKADKNKENRYMMIIPVEASVHQASLQVIYSLPGAKTFDMISLPLKDVNFEAGKSYDFKFKVSTYGISFGVTVEDWDTGTTLTEIKLN